MQRINSAEGKRERLDWMVGRIVTSFFLAMAAAMLATGYFINHLSIIAPVVSGILGVWSLLGFVTGFVRKKEADQLNFAIRPEKSRVSTLTQL